MFVEHRARLQPAVMKYQPAEYRNTGHLLKRLVDCDVETNRGHKCQTLESMMMIMVVVTMIKLLCYVVSTANEEYYTEHIFVN
jgi:hypothetical protein